MRIKRLGFAGLARWCRAGAAALSIAVAACAHAPETPAPPCAAAEPLRVTLTASERLNPDDKGAALATVVRLYQLKGLEKLKLASFDDLLDHDREALGEDFAVVQEVTINPGERAAPPVARNPDASYLVVVALFRRPTELAWRAVTKLPASDPQFCHAKDQAAASRNTLPFALDENRVEFR
jgi:type VI secretion system protein VasD